jgi:orotidine-5'-phosphate decarboxylase
MVKPTIIIALDFPTGEKALAFLDQFQEPVFVKVGMELYYSEGPSIIEEIKKRGHRIFLDLKLHDIPNTVKSAMKVLARLGVDMTNVHAAGGIKMMQAAKEGLAEGLQERGEGDMPMLIAVTQLTSTDEETLHSELLVPGSMEDVVVHYAKNACEAGLDGVVCSAWESPMIHQRVGADFQTVTPGIRLLGDAKGDQSRVATPAKSMELGSNYLVIGRSITRAEDPVAAYRRCEEELRDE